MGCGLSLFRKPTRNSFPEDEASVKTSVIKNTTEPIGDNADQFIEETPDFGNDDADDYERELQQLNDDKGGVEDTTSPPPTLDESMSDHGSPPLPIAATVTLKTLESPRSVIFTSSSRPSSSGGIAHTVLRELGTGSPPNIVETNELDDQFTAASPSRDFSSEQNVSPVFDEDANEIQDVVVTASDEPQENEQIISEEISGIAAEDADNLDSTIVETTEEEVKTQDSDENDVETTEISKEPVDEQEKEDEIGTSNPDEEQLANEEIVTAESDMVIEAEPEEEVNKSPVEDEESTVAIGDAEESGNNNPAEDEIKDEVIPDGENPVEEGDVEEGDVEEGDAEQGDAEEGDVEQGDAEEGDSTTLTQENIVQGQEEKEEDEVNVIEEENSPVDELVSKEVESSNQEELEREVLEITEDNVEFPESAQDDNINTEENVGGNENDEQATETEIQPEEVDETLGIKDDTPKEEEMPDTYEANAEPREEEVIDNPQVDEGQAEVNNSNEDEPLNVDADAQDQALPELNEDPSQELENAEVPEILENEEDIKENEMESDLQQDEQVMAAEGENVYTQEEETLIDENLTDSAIIADEIEDQDGLVDDDIVAENGNENLDNVDASFNEILQADEPVNSTDDPLVDTTETALQQGSDEVTGIDSTVAQDDNSTIQVTMSDDADQAEDGGEPENNLAEEQISDEQAAEALNENTIEDSILTDADTNEAIDSNNIATDIAGGDIVAFEDNQEEQKEDNELSNDAAVDGSVPAEELQASEQVDELAESMADAKAESETEKENVTAEQDFNQIFDDGNQEATNDDEEEIWRKLQKDIQLEEEEQQHLAATRIQSTFRGYKARKELNQQSGPQEGGVEEGANNQQEVSDEVDNINENPPDQQDDEHLAAEETESVLGDDEDGEKITEALAGITETVATVALFMTDSSDEQLSRTKRSADDQLTDDDHFIENYDSTPVEMASACPNEVNDVKEEPLSNGEEVNDVQLINTYVIQTGKGLEETPNNDENEKEEAPDSLQVEDSLTTDKEKESDAVDNTDPEMTSEVFELYVESNETTNDGLLQSCWQENLKTSDVSSEIFDPNALNTSEYETAATKIQAGYRGYRDRKLMKTLEKTNSSDEIPPNPQPGHSEKENAAALKIQAGYRGHRDRKRVKDLKDDKVEEILTNEENNFEEETNMYSVDYQNAAATKIQAGFRGHRDRKQLKRLRSLNDGEKPDLTEVTSSGMEFEETNLSCLETELERENAAATKIQAGFRGHRDRERVKGLQNTSAVENNKSFSVGEFCEEASDSNNSVFVGNESTDPTKKAIDDEFLEREHAAATKIQAGFRGHRDRERVKSLQNTTGVENRKCFPAGECCNEASDFNKSVCIGIESKDPTHDTTDNETFKREHDAATKIQAGFRGHRDREKVKGIQALQIKNQDLDVDNGVVDSNLKGTKMPSSSMFDERHNAAAIKIQSGYRGYRERKHLKRSKSFGASYEMDCSELDDFCDFDNVRRESLPHMHRTSSQFTGIRRRDSAPNLYYEDIEKEEIGFDCDDLEQEKAAIKIQSNFRGYRVRKEYKAQQAEPSTTPATASEARDNDAENQAAVKIQAGYRGYRTRKNMQPNV